MKKTIKKLTAVGLTLTSVMGLVACGSSNDSNAAGGSSSSKEVTKPDKFTIMCDSTVVTETNGAAAFYEQLKTATGLDFQWTRPDHSGYYDAVANAFNSDDTMPDVILLSSDYYALYASNGFLWNMTDAWNSSETKKSGRLISTADVEGKTLDFNTYYGYLKQMAANKGHYVISAPGFISNEAPYTNYLPEFYQQANYTFYKNSSGQYVDGFSEDKMKEALQRIQTAVNDGIIDKESVNNSTSNARDKFYSTDAGSESGVFTYWAGTWANTLKTQLATKGLDNELIAIKPITELGTYVERIAPCWCITTAAKNPEGIFKYFIDTMLDGGDVQTLWEYGAKGTHWDTKAETVTLAKDDEGKKTKTYEEGQFHFLPQPESPDKLMSKNHIDPILALAKFQDGKEDPGASAMTETAKANGDFFAENSTVAVPLPMTTALSENITDINTARNYVISQVALGYMTVDEGMNYYKTTVGSLADTVLKSLNK